MKEILNMVCLMICENFDNNGKYYIRQWPNNKKG